jgi:two-component system chemotaxis response regulator CheB
MMRLSQGSPSHHDIIVIGGSAGSFGVIKAILIRLPPKLPAAVLIATHIAPTVSLLSILEGSSSLPIKEAASGEPIEYGRVYVAVPDNHLLIHDDHLLVRRGPRENFTRPAIDPLFRSAACAFGGRVVGILLSGGLNDGSAGLAAIKRCGGLAIVQDPRDAEVASMPEHALQTVAVDYAVPAAALPELLLEVIVRPAGETPSIPDQIRFEVSIAAQEAGGMELEDKMGTRSPFTCPDCDGVLWQVDDQNVLRFRCHIGHAVTATALLEGKSAAADATLARLLRTHEERAAIARKMAADALHAKRTSVADSLNSRAAGYEEDAAIVRRLIAGPVC